ncbi:daxx domain protein, putative [Rhizoctonia solani AG-3 Rhs1AP]|uniref:Daxx domain protein, putative n=2 Tax=Rhizoctonia solani AG-3 TaxID=1086053 RepID=X8J637_9AGAM|nr:daxx domain protein, putative [Rhizoctonia solani AG-3 Rhs1AP]KEP52399.1 putative daxx domain protein [Rhizoctonia solani 123E]
MDTLRSLPESLSAVRSSLRHILRELVGGKVEISYVPAPSSLPSPTPSPTPTLDSQPPVDKMPSPWGFMTSGYALGLLLMAVLLNRISNVVVPPRQAPPRRQYSSRRQRWLPSLLPINISATHTRFISRVPSIGLLATSLFLLSIALLQAADIWQPLDMRPYRIWYLELCRWAGEKEMAYVCWTTYIAVCVAMVMNTLTRGLEGAVSDGPHSFNLFGYSFLLHIYASPIMHQSPKYSEAHTDTPSRPDKHVLITIILPLLQLTILHILAINKRLSRQRLVPTTACGLLSITHFTYVTLLSQSTYPFFTYLNSLLEAFLVGIVLLTCALHCLTRLLLQGRFVWNPFAEEDGVAHQSLLPNMSDDYAVALLKLGSACIEVTAMAGFGNEVSPIHASDTIYISHSGPIIPKHPNAPPGLAREIKSVHAIEPDHSSASACFDIVWTKEVGRFGKRVARVAKNVWGIMTRRERPRENEEVERKYKREGAVYDIQEVYARYLLGEEVMSDDEDDEFRPGADVDESESDLGTLSEEEEEEEDVSAPTLYADLARRSLPPQSYSRESSPSVPALTPMLIAHLTSPSRTPLTRNRYTALSYPPTLALPQLRQRPTVNADEDPRAVCVICTVEPRGSLASRMGAGKHQCPCCRRGVEGYSRIFIP